MPRGKVKAPKPEAIKAAADRAEAISRGEEIPRPYSPLEPSTSLVPVIGRPTDYDPSYVTKVQELCENGATEPEIADILGVTTRTIYRWKLQHKAFCLAISIGKHIADTRVERSLFQKAVGYSYTEQQALKVKVGKDLEEVRVVEVERFAQAELPAQQFWLKNRKSQNWRDVQQIEHGRPGEFAQMSDDELKTFLLKEAPEMLTSLVDDDDSKSRH